MQNDVSRDLGHWQEIARILARKYNQPFRVVKDRCGAYEACSMTIKTECVTVWTTDDVEPEPVAEVMIEPPVLDKNQKKLAKAKALLAKLQAEIAKLEGAAASGN